MYDKQKKPKVGLFGVIMLATSKTLTSSERLLHIMLAKHVAIVQLLKYNYFVF